MISPDRDAFLEKLIGLLKEHGYDHKDIVDAYHGKPSIPVTAYTAHHTPLEATVLYLATLHLTTRDIAAHLHRPSATIRNALMNAKKKGLVATTPTTYTIPVSAFTERLTPAEAVILSLHQTYKLRNKDVAALLHRDPRNIAKVLQHAKQKGGAS